LNIMTQVTGILEWPTRAEGRVRQLSGSTLIHRDDDPYVPLSLGERFKLRPALEVTVEVGFRGGRPHGQLRPGQHPHSNHPQHRGPSHRGHPYQNGRPQGPPGGWNGGGGGGGGGGRPVVESIVAIEGQDPEQFARRKPFDELTSIDPQPRLTLEYPGCPASCRLTDLFCPIGRGQRGLIVSPPKAGKTTLLKDLATAILRNHPDVEVWVLLVDERPEEVTDFRRSFAEWTGATPAPSSTDDPVGAMLAGLPEGQRPAVGPRPPRCFVVGSSNDHDAEKHIAVATLTIERCKRMVEAGKHVVVLMDSLTRLGRAFNRSKKHSSSGRTLSGGIDSKALEVPKQLFGAARNTEEAGSLTIIASCLVDTGSQGDQVIFEEFKGTGNMELILDRKISERRLFPAINLAASGTRKEHLLQPDAELKTIGALRRRLLNMPPHVQVEQLLAALQRFPTNAALVGQAGT
jgi:transcription termination factor Rho